MEKIIIFGSNNSIELSKKLQAKLIEVPDLYVSDYGAVNDYVINKLKQESYELLIIDADNIRDSELALALALYTRLSVFEIGITALIPIVIVSDKTIKSFLHLGVFSQIILTKSVYFQQRGSIEPDALDAVVPLNAQKYREDFLDHIVVGSGPENGRHSLANQWGASVIERLLNGGVITDNHNPVIQYASKSLYFKYVLAKTLDVVEYLSVNKNKKFLVQPCLPIEAKGKRILLIDDEASKGWEYVLKKLIVTNEDDFKVIDHKVKDYVEFTEDEQRQIEEGNFDLIFLDLRMNGIDEEDTYRPEGFSGMKILKKIKQMSVGTQVIVFTASNKAWNLKALLDAGADGYYIKESPEYNFSITFSEENLKDLRNTIQDCLKRSYLRQVEYSIKKIRKDLLQSHYEQDFKTSVVKQIESSFVVLQDRHFALAFITLCQTIEIINKHYLKQGENGKWFFEENGAPVKNWSVGNAKRECREVGFTDEDLKEKYPEWKKAASIYYQLWQQKDLKFGDKLQGHIEQRNFYMHNDPRLKKEKIDTPEAYLNLLDVIMVMCNYI